MLPSQSRLLIYISLFPSLLALSFGINALLRPLHALTFYNNTTLPSPSPTEASYLEHRVIEALMQVYGARDVFWGVVTGVAAVYGERKTLGWAMVVGGGVAGVDGWVCKAYLGGGEWDHWGYAPVLGVVGLVLLGVLD